MDTLNNNNNSHNCSYDSSEELKSCSTHEPNKQQPPKMISPHRQRAMSFLYCISKRLGRRRCVQQDLIYTSQDDLRSSSTDSFSLSLDRGSSSEKHLLRSSSIDLSSDGAHSRASSSSSSSSNSGSSRLSSSCGDENVDHVCSHQRLNYVSGCYVRSASAMTQRDEALLAQQQQQAEHEAAQAHEREHEHDVSSHKFSARTPLKGLNLNRISISSVSRVLQHISSSSSSSASMRSLSCNSTPLKRSSTSDKKCDKQNSSSSSSSSSSSGKQTSKSKTAKPQPQQQRILRQPVNYVYLKGMSGLPTRRVPRSSLCCSYAYR